MYETIKTEGSANMDCVHEIQGVDDHVLVSQLYLNSFISYHITLDPRLPFLDSVGGIFSGQATTQKVLMIESVFPAGGATIDLNQVLSILN